MSCSSQPCHVWQTVVRSFVKWAEVQSHHSDSCPINWCQVTEFRGFLHVDRRFSAVSQGPATGPYREPDKPTPSPPTVSIPPSPTLRLLTRSDQTNLSNVMFSNFNSSPGIPYWPTRCVPSVICAAGTFPTWQFWAELPLNNVQRPTRQRHVTRGWPCEALSYVLISPGADKQLLHVLHALCDTPYTTLAVVHLLHQVSLCVF